MLSAGATISTDWRWFCSDRRERAGWGKPEPNGHRGQLVHWSGPHCAGCPGALCSPSQGLFSSVWILFISFVVWCFKEQHWFFRWEGRSTLFEQEAVMFKWKRVSSTDGDLGFALLKRLRNRRFVDDRTRRLERTKSCNRATQFPAVTESLSLIWFRRQLNVILVNIKAVLYFATNKSRNVFYKWIIFSMTRCLCCHLLAKIVISVKELWNLLIKKNFIIHYFFLIFVLCKHTHTHCRWSSKQIKKIKNKNIKSIKLNQVKLFDF